MANSQNTVNTFTGDDSSEWYKFIGPVVAIFSGATLNGTTKVQRRNPTGTTVDVVGASFTTTAGSKVIDYPEAVITELRWNVASSTTPAIVAEFKGREA